ncbi:MAG: DUF2939 domain-containing protein [Gammaproteobacteria bacterium]|nr:DUF2939 domain-containing protein [Gammaproteobacteria bacterium]
MKLVFPVLFLVLLIYIGWPYANLFRLDRALMTNDQEGLSSLIDLDAVRKKRRQDIEREVDRAMGSGGMVPDIVQEGARLMGGSVVDSMVTMEWVREKLRWQKNTRPDAYPSIISDTTYAFFESPTKFLVRVGDLGLEPVHLRMVFEEWKWRITEIYD